MTDWDYDRAVALAKSIAEDWKKRTVDLARILYVAREKLSNSGFRTDLIDGTSGNIAGGCKEGLTTSCSIAEASSPRTWEDFCIDVGIPCRTARDWLACYDPDRDYLLERSEYKEAKQLELETLYEDVEQKRKTDENYVPADLDLKWNRNLKKWSETKYQKWRMEKEFSLRPEHIVPPVISRDARLTEFGLWNTDYVITLAQKCQEKTHADSERFTALCREWDVKLDTDRILDFIKGRDIMRALVIFEAVIDSVPKEKKQLVRALARSFLTTDAWNNGEAQW